MAKAFLSTANTFLHPNLPSSPSSSCCCSSPSPTLIYPKRDSNGGRFSILCKAGSESSSPSLSKRSFSISFVSGLALLWAGKGCSEANAAILEADDDVELLEKVKEDRKKRLERQGIINSSITEKGYLQDLVYKLSEVGQALEKNDLPAASAVLGGSTDPEWVQKANAAFTKLSYSPEEKAEVDAFNSKLSSLLSSVSRNDVQSSKSAFAASAGAFENWTKLTGLADQLKGL